MAIGLAMTLLVACDDGRRGEPAQQSGAGATTSTTAPPATTTPPATTRLPVERAPVEEGASVEGGSTSPATRPASDQTAYLTAVRTGAHPGYDRAVFEFEGGLPGFGVRYVERPIYEDGSGRPIEVDGGAVLDVRMERAATARVSGEGLTSTYKGPRRIQPSTRRTVVDLAKAGDFEAVLRWVIGARARVPFKVTTLASPSRLVIDLEHP